MLSKSYLPSKVYGQEGSVYLGPLHPVPSFSKYSPSIKKIHTNLYFPFLGRRLQTTHTHSPPRFFSQHFLEIFPVGVFSPAELCYVAIPWFVLLGPHPGREMVLYSAVSYSPESNSFVHVSVGIDPFRDCRGYGKHVILLDVAKFPSMMVRPLEATAGPH